MSIVTHLVAAVCGAFVGIAVMAILAAGADDPKDSNVFQGGPITPPADPNDPNNEWHVV